MILYICTMRTVFGFLFFFATLLGEGNWLFAQTSHQKSLILMGSRFTFTVRHESPEQAWKAIEAGIAEVQRIESLISSWDTHSQTSQINRMAGKEAVPVSYELFSLIRRALKVANLTKASSAA